MARVKKERKKREPKARQRHLPGMEPPSIPAIDQAADNYYDVMMERVKLSKEEDMAKDNLIDKMKEHQLDRYEYDGKIVTVLSKSNIKVKKVKEPSSNGEEES